MHDNKSLKQLQKAFFEHKNLISTLATGYVVQLNMSFGHTTLITIQNYEAVIQTFTQNRV